MAERECEKESERLRAPFVPEGQPSEGLQVRECVLNNHSF